MQDSSSDEEKSEEELEDAQKTILSFSSDQDKENQKSKRSKSSSNQSKSISGSNLSALDEEETDNQCTAIVGDSFLSNKQRQRANRHPLEKMAKTRAGRDTSRGTKSASKKPPSFSRASRSGTKNVARKLVQDKYELDEERSRSDSVEEEESEEEEETTGLTKDQIMVMQLTNLYKQQKGSRSKAPRSKERQGQEYRIGSYAAGL